MMPLARSVIASGRAWKLYLAVGVLGTALYLGVVPFVGSTPLAGSAPFMNLLGLTGVLAVVIGIR